MRLRRQNGMGEWPFDEFEMDFGGDTGSEIPSTQVESDFNTQSPMLALDYTGTESETPNISAVNNGSGNMSDFTRNVGNVFSQVFGTYATVKSAQAITQAQQGRTGILPPGVRYTQQMQTTPQPFLQTPTGKMLIPIGIAAAIFLLANRG